MIARRTLLASALALPLAALLSEAEARDAKEISLEMRAAFEARNGWPTSLWMKREATGEEVFADFRTREGAWLADGHNTLSWFMRDVDAREDSKVLIMSPLLFDNLARLQTGLSILHGSALPLIITSGYRTERTNQKTEGAARNSMHMVGKAADQKLPPYTPAQIAAAAATINRGGIGVYPSFVHLDVGAMRAWRKE